MPICSVALLLTVLAAEPTIKHDESVIFFPTYARLAPDNHTLQLNIHAWVFEPEEKSIKRAILLGMFRKFLGLNEDTRTAQTFQRRARPFLVDNEGGKRIPIRLDNQTILIGPSEGNGHIRTVVDLPAPSDRRIIASQRLSRGWATFQTALPAGDNRTFTGKVQRIGPTGTSVISDIDDTIKITGVGNKKALIANVFLNPYRPVPGMAKLYRHWLDQGTVFHYVSASPWPLYGPLTDFLTANGFPDGTIHLRNFRWTDSSLLDLTKPPDAYKLQTIEPILRDFPHRQFILVGDSGERDPETYGRLARSFPAQIQHIYIRSVTSESPTAPRFREAFKDIPATRWTVFTDPTTLAP